MIPKLRGQYLNDLLETNSLPFYLTIASSPSWHSSSPQGAETWDTPKDLATSALASFFSKAVDEREHAGTGWGKWAMVLKRVWKVSLVQGSERVGERATEGTCERKLSVCLCQA